MKLNVKKMLFGDGRNKRPPVLLAVTPPRTGERTLLGVENLLQSIAVPEPFSPGTGGRLQRRHPAGPLPGRPGGAQPDSPPTTPRPASARCRWRRIPSSSTGANTPGA